MEVLVRRLTPFALRTVAVISIAAASGAIPSAGLAAPTGQVSRAAQNDDALFAVASSGGWAVGSYITQTGEHSLIERWNGRAWKITPSPGPGRSANDLLGVAAVSSSSAWAVGYYGNSLDSQRTLIEHWNGRAWKHVASPNVGGSRVQNSLLAVAVVSSSNVWAVGAYINMTRNVDGAIIEHWNGHAWKIVPGANLGRGRGGLEGVAAVSSSNIWAVGSRASGAALIEHWNGHAWKVVRSPNLGRSFSNLTGVAAASSSSAWAVGIREGRTVTQALIEHWNGRVWKVVPSPNPGGPGWDSHLSEVAAASPKNVWVVGGYSNATTGVDSELTLIEHWNGRAWTQVPSPDPGGPSMSSRFFGVAAASSKSAWAVGSYFDGTAPQSLVAHWNGTAWTQVSSPNR